MSGYLDAELDASELATVERHVLRCGSCAGTLATFSHLEKDLSATPALTCSAALTVLSAAHDGEADAVEARVASTHLATCAACRVRDAAWTETDVALAALPMVAPPARVDAALERYRHAPVGSKRTWALPRAAIWPGRALAAAAVTIALLVATADQSGLDADTAIVASVQQSVLNPRTSTLYVLRSEQGAVAALDASTLATRTVISVGGRPTALALNAPANQILVLDALAKVVTAIDGDSNAVLTATTVDIPGTPTSLQIDSEGRVVVASIISPGGGGPAPSDAPRPTTATAPSGAVSVIDPATNQIKTVSQVDVAPRQFVIEPGGKRALLVSAGGTTIVDAATYKPLDRVTGGIAAAFSGASGEFAILSLRDGSALVTLSSKRTITIAGTPRGITALPDGGYAVLTDSAGRGRVTTVGADGAVGAAIDAPSGRDLTYDSSGKVAVIGPAGISLVALPAAVAIVPSPAATPSAPALGAPGSAAPNTSIAPVRSALPTASPSAAPSASASPSTAPTLPPFISEPSTDREDAKAALVPTGARLLTGDTYLYTPSRSDRPSRVAGDGDRIWMLDGTGQLSALHTTTGEIFQVAKLPAGAKISQILPARGYVYLMDPTAATLWVFTIRTDQIASYPIPFLQLVTDATTSPDDRLWFVAEGFGLVSFDPRTHKTEIADIGGGRFSAVGVDAIGRVWLTPRDRGTLDLYDPFSGKLSEMILPHDGTITTIVVDDTARVWVGTDSGQVFAIRNGKLDTATSVGRAIERLMIGPDGAVWYVSRAGGEVTFGPADGSALPVHGPLGMSSPMFDGLGRAWASDPVSGAFFVTLRAEGR